ncbi:Platelet-derived growth factor C [Fukomys damarensis]|uniref:Platelet-derived growth factor C n=1 Tax=Fukomys damarensis TaxID=885580 RepID=A0A091DHZ0_FUKDA|nr:Platelet-derived growth factor C [Fukomys damarensis]
MVKLYDVDQQCGDFRARGMGDDAVSDVCVVVQEEARLTGKESAWVWQAEVWMRRLTPGAQEAQNPSAQCTLVPATHRGLLPGSQFRRQTTSSVQVTEAASPASLPPSALPLELLDNAVAAFGTLEELIRYLEPDRWQLDLQDLYRPSWQPLGKAFVFGRKSKVVDLNLVKEEVRLYSCTPRNFSVSIREELKRTDTIFWPGCLLVKRCGGNCACCLHSCNECQCVPSKVTKKYHEVLQLRPKAGVRGLHKSLTDVALEHHEECGCVCRGRAGG